MRRLAHAGIVVLLTAGAAAAADTWFWRVNTPELMLQGRGDGVAVTADGRLERTDRWQVGPTLDEPVVMTGGMTSDGSLIVGTGHPARLYRIKGERRELLTSVPGDQVTALLVLDDNDVLVASVTPGILSRWRDNRLEEVARLGEGGIWDLVEFAGSVVAAAGSPATLYRLGERGFERWLELPDGHARALAVAGDRLLVGTSGQGLILGVSDAGRMALLADSPFTEISDLAVAPDGDVWATALVGEPVKRPRRAGNRREDDEAPEPAPAAVAIDLDLPKIDGATATSEVLRLTPEGALLKVHRFTKQVASALAWDGDGMLVGTGYEGEVWRFLEGGGARLTTVDAVQVVAIVDGGSALLTQGPGHVLWRREAGDREASYRIDAIRFPRPVRIGQYRIGPSAEGVRLRLRSGVSNKPDDTWLPWTDWLQGESGNVPLDPARSLQWELELADGAEVEVVEVALREVNLAPTVSSLSVEDPGVVFLAAPPPSGPVIDLDNPDFSGVFSVIDPAGDNKAKNAKGKKFYRMGFRTVSWKATDPNEDPLRFSLDVEREDGFRMPVREDIDGSQLALDTTAVPDGRYRFRLTATDAPRNPGEALEASRASAWFTVDNSPPVLSVARSQQRWSVTVEDGLSPLVRVEWSRDGERWNPLAPEDGLMDGLRESFSFPARDGRHLVVVRAIDRQHNRTTEGVVEE